MLLEGISTTTSGQFAQFSNTGGWLRMGVEGSSGGVICIGAPAYGTFFGSQNATSLSLATNANERLGITSDGRVYGKDIHNNAGAVTGTTNQYIASGTYTPTLTNTTNITGSSALTCQWMRVGNVATVSGAVGITTTGAGDTELGISLPIASAFTAVEQLSGSSAQRASGTEAGVIDCDTTNDRAIMRFSSSSGAANTRGFHFTYLIV